MYLKNKESYALTIFYEELIENPEEIIRILLHNLNVSDEYLPKALEALNVDSQQGIFGKRGLNQIRDHKYVFKELDHLFKKYSISMFCDINFDEFKCFVTCNTT